MKLRDLTEIERKTYEFIKRAGEVQPKNLPDTRMMGTVANLKNKRLVEIYKKYTSIYRRKKKKFVKAKYSDFRTCSRLRARIKFNFADYSIHSLAVAQHFDL